MKYAVITLSGKQHVVTEGETLTVDRLSDEAESKLSIKDVLLVVDGDKRSIGAPLVDGAVVTASIISHDRGEKIRVATYKAKSRVRKVRGHRQSETTLKIDSIKA